MQYPRNSIGDQRLEGVKAIFLEALEYREVHKDESHRIAIGVFCVTSAEKLGVELPARFSRVRDEFGALEAPGMSPDGSQSQSEFEDSLWRRLHAMVLSLS